MGLLLFFVSKCPMSVLSQTNPSNPIVYHTLLIKVIKATAHQGTVQLKSKDPTDPPSIDLKLYEADTDITRLALGIQLLRKTMESKIMQHYEPEEVLPGPSYLVGEVLEEIIKHGQ
ncbi:MAG: hypothetical protein F9K49_02705 [Caedimonadaceae bacterium]|nr:MAG: hypothetical protein F9K49_02705 [Caedimonadaceae bacterium]